jgi:hypothetical protein
MCAGTIEGTESIESHWRRGRETAIPASADDLRDPTALAELMTLGNDRESAPPH